MVEKPTFGRFMVKILRGLFLEISVDNFKFLNQKYNETVARHSAPRINIDDTGIHSRSDFDFYFPLHRFENQAQFEVIVRFHCAFGDDWLPVHQKFGVRKRRHKD